MLKIFFLGIIVIHSLIHLLGFIKAYDLANVTKLNQMISKPVGIIWLLIAIVFLVSAVLFLLKSKYWFIFGIIAVIVSQILIIMAWHDAKFGTIPNIIILLVIVLSIGSFFFEQSFRKDVINNFTYNNNKNEEILKEQNIEHLPESVKKYLHYSDIIGKPQNKNFYIIFEGIMRDKQKEFSFVSEQYNFLKEKSRLFFMKGKMFGINVPGYHRYMDQEASMDIKLFGLIPIIKEKNSIMFKSETVTTFSELCFFSPSSLIDKNIIWEEIDNLTAKATFSNKNVTITATLYFNSVGQLIKLISDDRYDISDMKQYRFSILASDYKNIKGRNVPTYVELIWNYPEGDFTYGELRLKNLDYNLQKIK